MNSPCAHLCSGANTLAGDEGTELYLSCPVTSDGSPERIEIVDVQYGSATCRADAEAFARVSTACNSAQYCHVLFGFENGAEYSPHNVNLSLPGKSNSSMKCSPLDCSVPR